jgi:septal ring factor EnvC (AmiA/AmiB activator)
MKSLNISNITLIVVALLVAYLIYDNANSDAAFKKKFDAIEAQRDSLQRAVQDILARSDARDKQLKELVGQNLKFIESLNEALNKKTKVSKEIQDDIKENTQKIDSLWLINS